MHLTTPCTLNICTINLTYSELNFVVMCDFEDLGISSCSPGCSGTRYVEQTGFKPSSDLLFSQGQGLQTVPLHPANYTLYTSNLNTFCLSVVL